MKTAVHSQSRGPMVEAARYFFGCHGGTPLFWLIFGQGVVFRLTSGRPIVRSVVILTLAYFVEKVLALTVPWLATLFPLDYEDAEKNQKEVTLVMPLSTNFSRYAGRRISVVDTLFHANTGHHHTPIFMSVQHTTELSK